MDFSLVLTRSQKNLWAINFNQKLNTGPVDDVRTLRLVRVVG